ncbi:aminotransferase class IV [Amphritea balenae]|uniref:Aminodeoxychorismate lyase n=1 Tax=Amphritea balenae TaxID=452629 RepID=A0A3P1SVK2_9GAMM|nr:aminotransferase class IV [Amphritea balenae]RRD01201.1 D-alanine aminotransferase [Amphritea balenae]GGK59045.1 D-amino acid aminotransferase [Amphritea balenae]
MSISYLNGEYQPLAEARISPLDRGFLFGDGIYEVIPYYGGKSVGLMPHINRMINGLAAIEIKNSHTAEEWKTLLDDLVERNADMGENLGVYVHISRGTDVKRYHPYPENVEPTIFCFCFGIKDPEPLDRSAVTQYSLVSTEDLRWQRCHIKSTALLGNVMHFQEGYSTGADEALLYNANNELTEGSSCNVFVVKDGKISTPIQDNQILPGITRRIILDSLKSDGNLDVEERIITMDEVRNADELWITSSSKEIAPVTKLDGQPVGNGEVGEIWEQAFKVYTASKFDF